MISYLVVVVGLGIRVRCSMVWLVRGMVIRGLLVFVLVRVGVLVMVVVGIWLGFVVIREFMRVGVVTWMRVILWVVGLWVN